MRIQDFDYSVDLLQSLLWQYNDATNIQYLIAQKEDWYNANQNQFWSDWYKNVFDLRTANDFGLSVWSIILNLPYFSSPDPDAIDKPLFGFGTYNENFNNGNFSNINQGIILPIEERRLVLQLRYFQLCTRGDILDINAFLNYLFGYGQVYALDGLNMTMRYIFNFDANDTFIYVLQLYDILPRPAAVGSTIINTTHPTFGFGTFYENFENGNFLDGVK